MDNLQQDFLNQSIANLENLINQFQNETERFSETFSLQIFRALHTIKGTSQTIGFPASGNLAHELENLLAAAKDGQNSAHENYQSLLLEGLELLKKTFERKDFEIPASFAEKFRAIAPSETEYSAAIFGSEIPGEIFSQLSNQETIAGGAALKAGKQFFCLEIDFDLSDFSEKFIVFREILAEKSEIIATLPGAKPVVPGRIGFRLFVAASENIAEIAAEHSADVIFQTAQTHFSNDLTGVFEQTAAHGRILAKRFGKQIDFEISAENREVSSKLLKTIFDALLHLVRNAVDHAIERSEERIASNKKPRGAIKMYFRDDEAGFYLTVSDDGRGIDAEKIRTKAIEKNLISAAALLSEREKLDLIFQPELSTAERLTDVSGRGIGLDAVKDAVEKSGGSIKVESRKGNGTTFEIFFPKDK